MLEGELKEWETQGARVFIQERKREWERHGEIHGDMRASPIWSIADTWVILYCIWLGTWCCVQSGNYVISADWSASLVSLPQAARDPSSSSSQHALVLLSCTPPAQLACTTCSLIHMEDWTQCKSVSTGLDFNSDPPLTHSALQERQIKPLIIPQLLSWDCNEINRTVHPKKLFCCYLITILLLLYTKREYKQLFLYNISQV